MEAELRSAGSYAAELESKLSVREQAKTVQCSPSRRPAAVGPCFNLEGCCSCCCGGGGAGGGGVGGGWWLVVVVVVVREKDWSPIRFTKKGHGARPYGPRSPKVVRGGEGWLYLTSNNNLVSGWAAMGRAGGEGAGGLKP